MRKLFMVSILGLLMFGISALAAVDWEHSYKAALEKAKKDNKLVMIDLYADWCGPCRLLDKNTFGNKDVQTRLSNGFIAVKIDLERSKETTELARKFGANAIPHVVFLDSDGKKLSDIIGYVPPDEFLTELDTVAKKAAKK